MASQWGAETRTVGNVERFQSGLFRASCLHGIIFQAFKDIVFKSTFQLESFNRNSQVLRCVVIAGLQPDLRSFLSCFQGAKLLRAHNELALNPLLTSSNPSLTRFDLGCSGPG